VEQVLEAVLCGGEIRDYREDGQGWEGGQTENESACCTVERPSAAAAEEEEFVARVACQVSSICHRRLRGRLAA
jgi:hypothetical protein